MEQLKDKLGLLCHKHGLKIVFDKISHLKCKEHNHSPETIAIKPQTMPQPIAKIELHGCDELEKMVADELNIK